MMLVSSCTPFSLSAPCDDILATLVCATHWLSMHLYTLAHMSMPCQCVVHASTQLSYGHPIQTYICLLQTPPFVYFLAYLPFCLFACFLASLLAMHTIMLIHFMPFHMLFAFFPSIACLLVSCLCLCMYIHGVRMLGARAQSPRSKQKGYWCKHVDISQVICSIDLGVQPFLFGFVLFKTPSFFLPFSLRWVILGIS